MSLTVGTLMARIDGDARPFTQAMAGVDTTAASSGAKLERVWGKVKLAAAAAAAAGAAAVAFGGIKAMANLEQFEVGLTTMLGSGEAARQMLGDLTAFARNTPFQMEGLAANTRQLLGVGIAAEDVIPALTDLGDASAALGLSQEQNDSVVRAFTQSMAKGKVQAEEMMQMAEAGLPVYQLFADALGVSKDEVLRMASAGELLSEDVLPKLLDQMGQDYGGGMAAQAKTLAGIWSTFQDDVLLGLASKLGPLKDFLATALPLAAGIAGDAFTVFGGSFSLIMMAVGPLLDLLARLPTPILTAVAAFLAWQKVGGFITPLVKKIGEAVGNLVTPMAMGASKAGALGSALSSLKGVGVMAALGGIIALFIDIAGRADKAAHANDALMESFDPSNTEAARASIAGLNADLAANQAHLDEMRSGGFDWMNPMADFFTTADENVDGLNQDLAALQETQDTYETSLSQLANMLGLTEAQTTALAESQGVSLATLGQTGASAGEVAMQLRAVADSALAADSSTKIIADSMIVLADGLSTAEEKGSALAAILRELAGDQLTTQEAQQAANDAIRGLGEAFTAAGEEAALAGISLLDASGNIDTTTAAGSALFDQANSVRDSMGQVAAAAFEAAGGTDNLAAAQAAAGEAANNVREDFITAATAALGSRDAAVALADSLGMIPNVVATAITQPGMDAAQLNLLTVASQLQSLPPNTPVNVTALTDEARGRLIDLGLVVQTLPDGTVVAYASTETARNALDALTVDRHTTIYASTVSVGGRSGYNAEGGIRQSLRYMAGGGLLGQWPAGRAAIFPAGREVAVVGDRPSGAEAYIPLVDRPQYQAILSQAARAMGRAVVPLNALDKLSGIANDRAARRMAEGGFAGVWPSQQAGGPSPTAGAGVTVNVHPSDRPSARQIREELAELDWLTGRGSL